MANSPSSIFRKCLNCGNLMELKEDSTQAYCCTDCARTFRRCPVCSRYFDSEKEEKYCSTTCAEVTKGYPEHNFYNLEQ